jgi:phosphoserine phosphatase
MQKTAFIAFDFDGTLYPFHPYDSEHLLMLRCASHKGLLNRRRARIAVSQDLAGKYDWARFTAAYRANTGSVQKQMFSDVARSLLARVPAGQFDLFPMLGKIADLGIISCGTENIAVPFLEQAGLAPLFGPIVGKRFLFPDPGPTRMEIRVKGPEDKARVFDRLRAGYAKTVAIGDGPTDLAMLEQADLALVVDWERKGTLYPYETFPTLAAACERAHAFLTEDREPTEPA